MPIISASAGRPTFFEAKDVRNELQSGCLVRCDRSTRERVHIASLPHRAESGRDRPSRLVPSRTTIDRPIRVVLLSVALRAMAVRKIVQISLKR
jgi:hypothetical protein